MKQKLRRFMAGFLAILTMFTTLFTNGTTAFAASSSANIAFWVASSKDHGVISEFNSKHTGSILYAMIDGHSAYCMNFGLSAKGGQLMNSDSNPNTNLSAAQEKLLAYCMYYGYSTTEAKAPTNDQCNKYIATQSMVWIIVNGIFGTSSADSAASKLCACAPDSSSSYSYYETLRDKINASYNATRPSFASKTKSDATTYELKWNESNKRFEYTFTDTNG
ncbi:MAG: thioester domain-containing protein, partial [Ruminococcus sp.]